MRLPLSLLTAVFASLYAPYVAAEKDVSSAKYIMKGCEILAYHVSESSVWKHMDADTERQVWMCGGALEATAQLMLIHHEFCPKNPENRNSDNLPVVAEYMKNHPEKLNEGMGYVIFEALQSEWPCPRDRN